MRYPLPDADVKDAAETAPTAVCADGIARTVPRPGNGVSI
jgi:hypothetical protein